MKRRPLALLCALVSLLSCHRFVGGDVGNVAAPSADGAACNNDVECASYACRHGACVAPAAGLVEIDGDCGGGGTCVGDAKCQADICVANGAACAADNTPCQVHGDCCNGTCTNSACGFGTTGGSGGSGGGCATQGGSCSSNSECCSGGCDLNTGACSDSCAQSGLACVSGTDCCSASCESSNGVCL